MKERKKRSAIWKIPLEDFSNLVKNSNFFNEILRAIGVSSKGGNPRTLKQRLLYENIDFSHIATGAGHNKGKKINKKSIPLEECLVENSSYCRRNLKKRLLKNGLIKNECSICGIKDNWNDKKLIMVLDHINGVSNDNRIENLRMVCPNCNSQQDTFAGRNATCEKTGRIRASKYDICPQCGKEKYCYSKVCWSCAINNRLKVKNRPSKEQLQKDIEEMPMTSVGKKYGVSDNAIRKWARKYGIAR